MYQYNSRIHDLLATAGLTWRRFALLAAFAVLAGLAIALLTPLRVS